MKKTTKTNQITLKLIEELKKHSTSQKSKFWKRIVKELQKPTRQMREVNLAKLNKYTKENETVFVPGKVLGIGDLDHRITVAAFNFSESAKNKLKNNIISIQDLLKKDPKGKNIRIMG
jgi:large subunit ribosomal protein L18e